jgi:hypothetical protein
VLSALNFFVDKIDDDCKDDEEKELHGDEAALIPLELTHNFIMPTPQQKRNTFTPLLAYRQCMHVQHFRYVGENFLPRNVKPRKIPVWRG